MHKIIKKLLREELNTHVLDAMFNELNTATNCDGCEYFNMGSLEVYGGFENPIYYAINKREVNELEYLTPKQYIFNIARGFGLSYEDALNGAYQDDKAIKYAKMMENGSKAPIGYYVDGESGQEGRHRAVAAMKLNAKLIPVVKITKNLSNEYINKFVSELKDLSREEVDTIYKNKGYHGISDLDWRELNNYINYRL